MDNPFGRQGLGGGIGGVGEAIEYLGGLNAQTPRAPSVGLWGRVVGFEQAELDELLRSYQVVKANLMRGTVHMVTRRQYCAWRLTLQPALERAVRQFCPGLWDRVDHDELVGAGEALLAEHDGLTRAELSEMLAARFPGEPESRWLGFAVRMLVPVVQVADETVWNPGRTRYILASSVLSEDLAVPEDGLPDLLRTHLAAFGPSTAADVSYATGLTGLACVLAEVAEVSGGTTRKPEYDVDHQDFDVPGEFVLPEYDNVFFAHKAGPLEPVRKRLIPNTAGRMHGSLFSDGELVAAWQHPPGELTPNVPAAARREFERFRDWYQSIDNMLS